MTQQISNKRPAFSLVKLGRFLIVPLFLCPSLRAQEQTEPPKEEEIILFEDEKLPPSKEEAPSQPSSALEEDFFIKAQTQARVGVRPLLDNGVGFPALGSLNVVAGLQAYPELYFHLSGFGRVPVDSDPLRVDAYADLGDSYMKLEQPHFVLRLGHLRAPWQVLRASALNDRLNPVDYRRGVDFPRDLEGRIPQWGLQIKGSLLGWSTEGIYFFWHRPAPRSLVYGEQNGVQAGHYQSAIAATRRDLEMFVPKGTPVVVQDLQWFLSPTFGVRARRNIGDVDLGFNALWGYDEVLDFQISQENVLLASRRAFSLGADMSWALGVVILKAEAVVTPKIANDIGKVTILKTPNGIKSESLSSAVLGIGVDGEYGDWLSGSFELVDTFWFAVPEKARVHTIEIGEPDAPGNRFVQRLALAFDLNGTLFSEVLNWNLRGEAGIYRPDILAGLDVRHNFSTTGLYVGAYANMFYGVQETPGQYRSSATEVGALLGFSL